MENSTNQSNSIMCDGVIEYSVSVSTNIYSNSTHSVKKRWYRCIPANITTSQLAIVRIPAAAHYSQTFHFWRARLRRLFMGFAVFFVDGEKKVFLIQNVFSLPTSLSGRPAS